MHFMRAKTDGWQPIDCGSLGSIIKALFRQGQEPFRMEGSAVAPLSGVSYIRVAVAPGERHSCGGNSSGSRQRNAGAGAGGHPVSTIRIATKRPTQTNLLGNPAPKQILRMRFL